LNKEVRGKKKDKGWKIAAKVKSLAEKKKGNRESQRITKGGLEVFTGGSAR